MSRANIGRRKLADVIDDFLQQHAAGGLPMTESRYIASCLSQARAVIADDPGGATVNIKRAKRALDEAQARADKRRNMVQ